MFARIVKINDLNDFLLTFFMKVESPKNHKLSENKMKEQIAPLISTAPEQPT